MAQTFSQLHVHIVFSTKDHRAVLQAERRDELFAYMGALSGILAAKLS